MTDLSRNGNLVERLPEQPTETRFVDTGSARTFYAGQPVLIDASGDATRIIPFTSAVTLASGDIFLGIAVAGKVFAAGLAEDKVTSQLAIYGPGAEVGFNAAQFGASAWTNADLQKEVYFSDSGTLTFTSTSNLSVGKLTAIENGYVFIEIAGSRVA